MTNLRTDAPTSRRIVRAFLDFLDSVEPAPGVDPEGLEVARDCLAEVFRLSEVSANNHLQPNLLVDLFTSHGISRQNAHRTSNVEVAPSKPEENSTSAEVLLTSRLQDDSGRAESSNREVSKDELLGIFFGALENIRYFRPTVDGEDDLDLLERVTKLFYDAVNEIESSGCKTLDEKNLAEAIKTLGNKAMQSNLYSEAIERYSCAIALCGNNAVYYCNRAAAYTQIGIYDEAIRDCQKSIEIDPNYSKAYSRLGLVYYAQGKYNEAIAKGFKKALTLDPNNGTVKANIQVAQQKLREEREHRGQNQDPQNHNTGCSRNQEGPSPSFHSMSFDANSFPSNIASMFMNMAGNQPHHQGQSSENIPSGSNFSGFGSSPSDFTSMFSDISSSMQQPPQQQRSNFQHQSTGEDNNRGGETPHPPPFTSMPFGSNSFPINFSNMFVNMNGGGHDGDRFQEHTRNRDESSSSGFEVPTPPEINVDGNISFNLGGNQAPPDELMGTLRSMMGMFSAGGVASQRGSDNVNGNGNGNASDGNGRPRPS